MSELENIKAATNKVKDSLVKALIIPSRGLTQGEVVMAKMVFKDSIDYSKVKIYTGNYLPNQDEETYMTPNGNIYAPKKIYLSDYSVTDSLSYKHAFVHEMGHVWQYQKGGNVKLKAGSIHACAFFTKEDPYLYNIYELKKYPSPIMPNLVEHLPKKFLDYNLEAQAEIIADYWLLKVDKHYQMRDKNIATNVTGKGALSDVVKLYESKIRQVIP